MSRRRSIFVTATTNQAEHKITEEFLSNELHENLRCLSIARPPLNNAKQFFEKDIFVKPNKNAFHHIVRYLLMIIDPIEFRRHFLWPVESREAEFRNAALSYFNECYAKYGWNFGPFKMQVVLFPGGVEFMKIIIQLTAIAMQTELKRNGSSEYSQGSLTLAQARHAVEKIEGLYTRMKETKLTLESQITIIEHNTERMKKIVCKVLLASGAQFTSDDILNGDFLKQWQHTQNKIIAYEFSPAFDTIKHFADECENTYHKLSSEISHQYDWAVLHKKFQMNSKPPYTLDYQKLLQFFYDNLQSMIKANDAHKPNVVELDEQCRILHNLTNRVSTTLVTSDELDKNDSAIYLENSMSDSENSADLQYMMALLSTTPVISHAKISVTQRISLVNEFHLIPNLEHLKKSK